MPHLLHDHLSRRAWLVHFSRLTAAVVLPTGCNPASSPTATTSPAPVPSAPPGPDLDQLQANCRAAIDEALQRDLAAIDPALAILDPNFQNLYAGVDPLINDLSDYGSTFLIGWNSLRDLAGGNHTQDYVRQVVHRHLNLESSLRQSCNGFQQLLVDHFNHNEQELYIRLDAELDTVADNLQFHANPYDLNLHLNGGLVQNAQHAAQAHAALSAGAWTLESRLQSIVVEVLTRVVSVLAIRFGGTGLAEGGLLAGGAAAGPLTLGLSVLLAILIGLAVEYIIGRITRAQIRDALHESLSQIQREIQASFRAEAQQLATQLHANRVQQLNQLVSSLKDETHE